MKKLNFFSHERISDRLYIVTEGYSMVHRFTVGVVIGDDKVLAIDAGMGLGGNIREYIESFAGREKPMLCVCTHCHPDHVGGAVLFDEAYCSRLDWADRKTYTYTFSNDRRLADAGEFALGSPEVIAYLKEHGNKNIECDFLDVKDGDVFSLGGVEIEAIKIPGHTPGSMAYFNREEGYLFTGDSVNTDVHLEILDRRGMIAYREALKKLVSHVGEGVTFYPYHLPLAMDRKVAEHLIEACDEILAGKTKGDPPAEQIFSDRKNLRSHRIHYVQNAGVAYDAEKLGLPFAFEHLCFYSHEKYGERTYVVTENYSWVHRFTIGVIVGDRAVAVVDSGLAMDGELRSYITAMIGKEHEDKPMICLCTHGAIDHAGAASLFDRAYVNDRDRPMLPRVCNDEIRVSDLGAFALHNREVIEYGRRHRLNNHGAVFEDVDETVRFDLGGVTIHPIRTPGHTMGHLCYYCPEEKVAFVGDCINADVHIKRLQAEDMRLCGKWLERFLSLVDRETLLFAGHLNRPQRIEAAGYIADACYEIAEGKTAGDPPGEAIFEDQNRNSHMRMHYVANHCVVYNNCCECKPIFPRMKPYPQRPEKSIVF